MDALSKIEEIKKLQRRITALKAAVLDDLGWQPIKLRGVSGVYYVSEIDGERVTLSAAAALAVSTQLLIDEESV